MDPLEKQLNQILEKVSQSPKSEEELYPETITDEERRKQKWQEIVWTRFASADLSDFDEEIIGQAVAAIDTKHKSIMIVGGVGTGKTHLACAIAKEYFYQGKNAHLASVVDLLDSARPGGTPFNQAITRNGVLLLDDLGAEKPTEWTAERLYLIANQRWLNMLPNIVTTNFTKESLNESVGVRTMSRLLHQCEVIVLSGHDRRQEQTLELGL